MPKKFKRQILTDADIEQMKANPYPQQSSQSPAPSTKAMSNEEFRQMVNASVKRIIEKYESQPPAPKPEPAPKMTTEQRQQARWDFAKNAYRISREHMVRAAAATTDRTLSTACPQLVSVLRGHFNIYCVEEYSVLLAGVTNSRGGCFVIPNGQESGAKHDIWIDLSEIRQFSRALNLIGIEVLRIAICHEVGHVQSGYNPATLTKATKVGAEMLAWNAGEQLYRKYCRADLGYFERVRDLAIQTHL